MVTSGRRETARLDCSYCGRSSPLAELRVEVSEKLACGYRVSLACRRGRGCSAARPGEVTRAPRILGRLDGQRWTVRELAALNPSARETEEGQRAVEQAVRARLLHGWTVRDAVDVPIKGTAELTRSFKDRAIAAFRAGKILDDGTVMVRRKGAPAERHSVPYTATAREFPRHPDVPAALMLGRLQRGWTLANAAWTPPQKRSKEPKRPPPKKLPRRNASLVARESDGLTRTVREWCAHFGITLRAWWKLNEKRELTNEQQLKRRLSQRASRKKRIRTPSVSKSKRASSPKHGQQGKQDEHH